MLFAQSPFDGTWKTNMAESKAGKPEFESTRTASQDGKTLTISSTNYPADGSQPFKSEAKYMRVSKGLPDPMPRRVPGVFRTSMKTPPDSPAPGKVRAMD
jgi:hypothetical protein